MYAVKRNCLFISMWIFQIGDEGLKCPASFIGKVSETCAKVPSNAGDNL